MSFDPAIFSRLRKAAGKLNEARDEVNSCFRDAAEILDAIGQGLPVDTANARNADDGPFLAYRRMDGRYRLLVCCGSGPDAVADPWEESPSLDRIATVGQIPKLLERIVERADTLFVIADRAEATVREIRAAIGDV